MAINSSQTSVSTTATALVAADSTSPQSIAVRVPTGGSSVFVGPSGVTTSNGFEVEAGASVSIELQPDEVLYGIVASGTQAVHVLLAGVG